MKHRFLFLMALLALPLFVFGQMAIVPADTAASPCNRHFESAIKFIVDTQAVHPFSINADGGKVLISKGNLQYCPSRDEWRFAQRQYDRVGNGKQAVTPSGLNQTANYGVTTVFYDSIDYSTKDPTTKSGYKEIPQVPCNNLLISKYYDGWIDLFAWGTSGHGKKSGDSAAIYFYPYDLNNETVDATYNTYGYGPSYNGKHGVGAKNNNFDTLSGTNRYFDWGYANNIREYTGCVHTGLGGYLHSQDSTMYRPGVWRTLTSAEWTYMLTKRIVAGNDSAFSYVRIKYGNHPTDTVTGVLIYPDDFSFADAGAPMLRFGTYTATEIEKADWEAFERVGCVFLPAAQYIFYHETTNQLHYNEQQSGVWACYWYSTALDKASAGRTNFNTQTGAKLGDANLQYYARSFRCYVRLAQDYL